MMGCSTRGCDREADREIPPSSLSALKHGPDATPRRFCEPCYHAWRRGARTTFTNGPPQGSKIEREGDA